MKPQRAKRILKETGKLVLYDTWKPTKLHDIMLVTPKAETLGHVSAVTVCCQFMNNTVYLGHSVCSSKDPFDTTIGMTQACDRLTPVGTFRGDALKHPKKLLKFMYLVMVNSYVIGKSYAKQNIKVKKEKKSAASKPSGCCGTCSAH